VGTYTLRLLFVSDTFVGEDVGIYIQLKVDDVSALKAGEEAVEDEISDPEEDSLAGQMALMRGSSVKKSEYHGEGDDDDESSTDDDEESGAESSDDDD
jgi:translocation protein SEC63